MTSVLEAQVLLAKKGPGLDELVAIHSWCTEPCGEETKRIVVVAVKFYTMPELRNGALGGMEWHPVALTPPGWFWSYLYWYHFSSFSMALLETTPPLRGGVKNKNKAVTDRTCNLYNKVYLATACIYKNVPACCMERFRYLLKTEKEQLVILCHM